MGHNRRMIARGLPSKGTARAVRGVDWAGQECYSSAVAPSWWLELHGGRNKRVWGLVGREEEAVRVLGLGSIPGGWCRSLRGHSSQRTVMRTAVSEVELRCQGMGCRCPMGSGAQERGWD